MNPLIAALVAHRHARGLSQQNVADRMHVTRETIAHFERASPTLHTLDRYADAVGVRLTIGALQ